MSYIPARLSKLKSGDIFFEDVSGEMVRCEALESARNTEDGISLKAKTPLGEREFFEAKFGRPPRLYTEKPA